MRPAISVRINDAHLGIWQERCPDPSFYPEVFGRLIRQMRDRGWSIHQDPKIKRHYGLLNRAHRLGARGTLRVSIKICGRAIEVDWWAVTWPVDNRNGRRYDFRRVQRMTYLDRLRLRIEMRRVVDWLQTIAPVEVSDSDVGTLTPMQRIERGYAESWHSDKALGRPICTQAYNARSGDGGTIEHGGRVWFRDHKGHAARGTAYYHINNMWWVVAGGELRNLGSHEILLAPPANLRAKLAPQRLRRGRLEEELQRAVRSMDFKRAEILKGVLFGDEPTFLIWARDHRAYYRSNYSGYTADTAKAGRYTRAEAEREVRRVPHELDMYDLEGRRVALDRAA